MRVAPPLSSPLSFQAVLSSLIFNSSIIRSRITNFCTLPVTVIGSSSTKRMYFGTL
jgi:hypothetical protein